MGLVPAVTLRGRFTVSPVAQAERALPLVRARLVAALRNDEEPPLYLEETADKIFYERGYPIRQYSGSRIGMFDPGTIYLEVTGLKIAVSFRVKTLDGGFIILILLFALVGFGVSSGTGTPFILLAILLVITGVIALRLWQFRRWLKSEATQAARTAPYESLSEVEL